MRRAEDFELLDSAEKIFAQEERIMFDTETLSIDSLGTRRDLDGRELADRLEVFDIRRLSRRNLRRTPLRRITLGLSLALLSLALLRVRMIGRSSRVEIKEEVVVVVKVVGHGPSVVAL